MGALAAIVIGLAFGGGDQYLGSRIALGVWASSVSLMSAPWLVLPFLAGARAVRPRRAVALGSIVTAAALTGYFARTLSPVEGVRLATVPGFVPGLLRSELPVIAGAVVTGPLYGYLGWRWRSGRRLGPAAMVAGALCLEPVARLWYGQMPHPALVWQLEIAAGLAAAPALLALRSRATISSA